MTIDELIQKLTRERDQKTARMRELNEKLANESRAQFDEAEQREYDQLKADATALNARIKDLRDQDEEEKRAGRAGQEADRRPDVRVVSEPRTYRRGGRASFFADVALATINRDEDAWGRLRRHAQEQAAEIRERQQSFERFKAEFEEKEFDFVREGRIERLEMLRWERELEARAQAMGAVETRDIGRTDGAGGEFVPPLWLVDEYVALARAGRVTADRFNNRPLPPGTDSINIPRVTGGASTGVQTADNAAVTEVDPVTASVSVPVRTIAGQVDVALQLLEQSPIAFDEVVFADLIADYNSQLDVQVINGSGAAGQVLGLLQLTGTNAVTYTDTTPTVPELWPKIADALNQSATGRRLPPTAIIMSPRRWFWITAALDTQNRPLVAINAPGLTVIQSGIGIGTDPLAEGPVGFIQGLPVYIDPNVPLNLGAGTNEDRVIVSRFLDHWLWESILRSRALPEVGSGNLMVRLQVYNYVAATAGRYPAATSIIAGTGLVPPTF